MIQDLSDPTEMDRYKNCNVYRRFETFGIPLYFAPHFTRNAEQPEGIGISYLSKVLGTLTMRPGEIDNVLKELSKFTKNEKLKEAWINGVKLDAEDRIFTYYFLDTPVKLNNPLKKDSGIKKGRGKNWIMD